MKQRQADRKNSAAEEYRQLLRRIAGSQAKQPSEEDVELLDTLAEVLRRDATQLETDLAAVRKMVELDPIASEEQSRKDIWQENHKSIHEHQVKMDAEVKRLTEENLKLQRIAGDYRAKFIESHEAREAIAQLRRQYVHLFA